MRIVVNLAAPKPFRTLADFAYGGADTRGCAVQVQTPSGRWSRLYDGLGWAWRERNANQTYVSATDMKGERFLPPETPVRCIPRPIRVENF